MAIMVRPIAPLGGDSRARVVAARVAATAAASRNAVVYALFAAIGPAFVLWSQGVLYGDPFAPGYLASTGFFNRERIPAGCGAVLSWDSSSSCTRHSSLSAS